MSERARKKRGYTVMEVMMSLAILGLGASGVIAMQRATIVANNNGRNLATATAVAAGWVERLRSEALRWNDPAKVPDLSSDTQWLKNADYNPNWFTPIEVLPGNSMPAGSPDADVVGNEIYPGDTSAAAFCTQLRLTKFYAFPKLIRAEIRVFWDRSNRPVDCSVMPELDPNPGRYGMALLTTAIQQNTAPPNP